MYKKIVIFFFLGFILFFFHTRGIAYNDEGYIVHSAQRMLQGEVPYKDFQIAYTPGSFMLVALVFKLFGQMILVERLMMLLISLLTIIIIFLISKKSSYSFFLTILTISFYISWGPTHINFAWPVMFTLFTGFSACLFLIISIRHGSSFFMFLVGVFTIITFLFKQNFGLALFLNNIFTILFIKKLRDFNLIKYYFFGLFSTLFLFIFYLYLNHSFDVFIETMQIRIFERIIFEKSIDTPFIYYGNFFNKLLKTVFYLSPLLISCLALFLSFKKKYQYFFLSSFCFFYYLFGIRPTTDYIHFVPLLSLSGFSFITAIKLSENYFIKIFLIFTSILFIIIGFYTALYKGYMRWETPLIENNSLLIYPKINIWVDTKYASTMPALSNYIKSQTKDKDYIFISRYVPMLYFSSDRKNATDFDYLSLNELNKKDQLNAISDIKNKNVELVLTPTSISEWDNNNSLLADYIKKNYAIVKKMNEFVFWKKYKNYNE